jgi:GntR family transcriptional regulator, galactonate operon transcriptional repressor
MQIALSAIPGTSSEITGGPARSLPMHEALCVAIETGDPAGAEEAVPNAYQARGEGLRGPRRAKLIANDAPV